MPHCITWSNRMALDIILAERGGVCIMFGDKCCTYIPNNTAPHGAFTRAMAKLELLSVELKANAGHGQWKMDWFDNMFGF